MNTIPLSNKIAASQKMILNLDKSQESFYTVKQILNEVWSDFKSLDFDSYNPDIENSVHSLIKDLDTKFIVEINKLELKRRLTYAHSNYFNSRSCLDILKRTLAND